MRVKVTENAFTSAVIGGSSVAHTNTHYTHTLQLIYFILISRSSPHTWLIILNEEKKNKNTKILLKGRAHPHLASCPTSPPFSISKKKKNEFFKTTKKTKHIFVSISCARQSPLWRPWRWHRLKKSSLRLQRMQKAKPHRLPRPPLLRPRPTSTACPPMRSTRPQYQRHVTQQLPMKK